MCLGITEEGGHEGPSSSIVYVAFQEDVTFDSLHESITKPMAGLWTIAHLDHPARIFTSRNVSSAASYLESLSQDPTNGVICLLFCPTPY